MAITKNLVNVGDANISGVITAEAIKKRGGTGDLILLANGQTANLSAVCTDYRQRVTATTSGTIYLSGVETTSNTAQVGYADTTVKITNRVLTATDASISTIYNSKLVSNFTLPTSGNNSGGAYCKFAHLDAAALGSNYPRGSVFLFITDTELATMVNTPDAILSITWRGPSSSPGTTDGNLRIKWVKLTNQSYLDKIVAYKTSANIYDFYIRNIGSWLSFGFSALEFYSYGSTFELTAGTWASTTPTGTLWVTSDAANSISATIYAESIQVSDRVNAANGFFQTSDERQKNIISDLSLDKVYDLIDKCQTIIYTLKDDESNKKQVGMIAQEIQEFFPELVTEDKDGMLSLDYSRLTVIIFKVLKDLIKRIEKLENN